MKNYRRALAVMMVLVVAVVGGCCVQPVRPVGPVPSAISVEEQVRRLSEWSGKMPGIKATTVLAGVRLEYRDDKGKDHTINTEGYLWIRQRFGGSAAAQSTVADVLLLGKSFNRNAFEAGRNSVNWWFAIRADTNEAWVGDATVPLDYAGLGSKGGAAILRADLVPELLGISKLPANAINPNGTRETGGGPITMMLVRDESATNNLLVGQMSRAGQPFLSREIVVDRYTGHVVEVRLYDPEGVVVVRSRLSEYKPVKYEEGTAPAAVVPEFPRRVEVSFPSQHMVVALAFGEVVVDGGLEDSAFRMPRFEREGLKVMGVE